MSDWYSESEKALQRQADLRDEVTQLRAELEAVKAERDRLLDNPDFVDYLEATCERDNLNQELSDALFHCGVLEAEVERLSGLLFGDGTEAPGGGYGNAAWRGAWEAREAEVSQLRARVAELEAKESYLSGVAAEFALTADRSDASAEAVRTRLILADEGIRLHAACIASLEAQLAASQAALRAVLPFIDDQPVRRWDALADAFYADTGIMAPGKSVAPEMAMSQPPDDVRRDQYAKWIVTKQGRVRALIDAALAAKPERPAGGES